MEADFGLPKGYTAKFGITGSLTSLVFIHRIYNSQRITDFHENLLTECNRFSLVKQWFNHISLIWHCTALEII